MINQGTYWWIRGGGTNCEAQYLFQLKPESFVSCHFPTLQPSFPVTCAISVLKYSPHTHNVPIVQLFLIHQFLFLTSKANFNLGLMSRPLGASRSGYIITNSVRDILESTNNSMLCWFIMKTSTWKSYLQLTITFNVNLTAIHILNVRIYWLICHTSDCSDRPANTFERNKPSNVIINAERLH